MESDISNLTQLGSKKTTYLTDKPRAELLEWFPNQHQQNDYLIPFDCPEFTSLCPKTGQPDFCHFYINYIPNFKCVESKSLKLYLFSFRNTGEFMEDLTNRIMKDLINLLQPKYIEVFGDFYARGGIALCPFASYYQEGINKLDVDRILNRYSALKPR